MVWGGAYKIRVHDSKCLNIAMKFEFKEPCGHFVCKHSFVSPW